MKIKDGFMLRKFGGKWLAVTVDDAADEKNILITLNDTAAFVWELLQDEVEYSYLISRLIEKYEAEESEIKKDLDNFLEICRINGVLDE